MFVKGQRVSKKLNIFQKGEIQYIMPPENGYIYVEVHWDNGEISAVNENELIDEVNNFGPWDLLSNNSSGDFRNFLIATTFHKVRNSTSNTISSLKASRTIFYPYQYKPLVKFLRSDIKRILIADEVGLGKTIEAGHIMLELAARGNLNNVLVICTNSLKDKWKYELFDKFNFILKKYESTKDFIQELKDDIDTSRKSIFGVVNYEKLRNTELQKLIEENSYRFDLVICDEAHKIRNSDTLQHKGVAKVIDNTDAVVFLTATPIMTDIRNLYNLIRVLDKDRYSQFDIFNNAVNMNKPFVKALSHLNLNKPLNEIAKNLHDSTVLQQMTVDDQVFDSIKLPISRLFDSDELYNRARSNMLSGDNSLTNKVNIQQDLIELNSLNHLYTRTRKKDVMKSQDVVLREPRTILINLSDEERNIYNDLIDEYLDENNLGLLQKKRMMMSCIGAYRTDKETLLNGKYDKSIEDSKFNAFNLLVSEIVKLNNKKLIVFAFFTKTLLYLKQRLSELDVKTEIIYGGIKDRTERIENFKNKDDIKILLSSEVGSEGIDLQFCDAMVNYDLPWNPMVVEQRIGRIDRVGQKSKVINIYNLILSGTIEERIHSRLYERINLFRESLGDLEAILGETEALGEMVTKGIENLYKTNLSEHEQNHQLDQLRLAIENEKLTLEKIQSELSDSFANDLHFQNEIDNITENNRYLTQKEITEYVHSIVRIELSTIHLEYIDNVRTNISLPINNKNLLFDFIEKYMDEPLKNQEIHTMYRTFKTKNIGSTNIQVTFNQEFAYRNRNLEYISAFHPFINAITNYFEHHGFHKNQAYKLSLSKKYLDHKRNIEIGYYILTIFKISVIKTQERNKQSNMDFIYSTIIDVNGDSPSVFDKEKSDHIFGKIQLYAEKIHNDISLDSVFVDTVRPFVMSKIMKMENEVRRDEEVKFLSNINRRTKQEINYVNSRINRLQSQIDQGKGIKQILLAKIHSLEQKEMNLLKNQKSSKIEVTNSLISTNLIQII